MTGDLFCNTPFFVLWQKFQKFPEDYIGENEFA